jgi:hypothetical protein
LHISVDRFPKNLRLRFVHSKHNRCVPCKRNLLSYDLLLIEKRQRFARKFESSGVTHSSSQIKLATSDQPNVSIIIVVFNQAELTFECLRSPAEEARSYFLTDHFKRRDASSKMMAAALDMGEEGSRPIRNSNFAEAGSRELRRNNPDGPSKMI